MWGYLTNTVRRGEVHMIEDRSTSIGATIIMDQDRPQSLGLLMD